jgi:hypothetical protein
MKPIDLYFESKAEPDRGCRLFLRSHIMALTEDITEDWKYGMPFYCYRGKRFCYLWIDKKRAQPYIGFVDGLHLEHPDLLREKRSRMKILLVDPKGEIPLPTIDAILHAALSFVKTKKSNIF